ncbi:MAG TPA: sigma-54 dependent transcriptional regulator [Methylomirabilota bacterium]|jgi:DNA-binding NtrC family response regulator|nr:sigma-54 dependent transcriptional regulator [Methylomirabilota bacterium]
MKRRVLIVEDDEVFLRPLRRALELGGFDVLTASSGEEALDLLKREDADLALTDQRLPGMDGVEVVRRIRSEHPDVGIVVMTAYGTIGAAVEATRLGAEDYLVKPFEPDEILLVLRRALEFRELRDQRRQSLRRNQERFTLTNLVAKSAEMLEILALLREVARLDTTVLIHGETGVGKELLSRMLHFSGPRHDKPFVAVNCAAIPEELFESELFGYRRGAFTGATEPRRGHFQLASGGTLLLDEIAEMPLGLQSKLLRALEEKKVTPIGAERPVDVDVRFIATTNRDLRESVEKGSFRRDLYYRLSVLPIRVPPLRERREDLPLLAQHFLAESGRRCKKAACTLSPGALEALMRYPWPGNVRELENVIERAVIVAREPVITDVGPFLAPAGEAPPTVDLTLPFRDAKARVVEEFERAYVAGVLGLHGGKLSAAARHADMDNKNLWEKMVRYGLRSRAAAGEPPESPV